MESGANQTIYAYDGGVDAGPAHTFYTVPAGKVYYLTYAMGYRMATQDGYGKLYINTFGGATNFVIAAYYQGYIVGQTHSNAYSSNNFTMPLKLVAGTKIMATCEGGDEVSFSFCGWLQNV